MEKKILLLLLYCSFFRTTIWSQCDNHALHFDGEADFITLNPLPTAFTPNSDFTVQMWFRSDATGGDGTCGGDFRRLFALAGTGNSRFEVGECGGFLSIYWNSNTGSLGPVNMSTASIRDNDWHCLSLTRSGTNVDVWLDGGTSPFYSVTGLGMLNSTVFRVGHWANSAAPTPGSDWNGPIDDIRLWNSALPAAQLMSCEKCLLSGEEPGLIAYWNLDQGTELANNVGITMATAPNGNNGVLSTAIPGGFALLPGANSNFICSEAALVYPNLMGCDLEIKGILPASVGPVSEICSGDPVHFCLKQNGTTPQPPPGMHVQWEYNDDGLGWLPVTDTNFIGLCFPVQHITTDCSISNPDGYTDRKYRAQITVTDPLWGACTYTSDEYDLKICCPIPTSTVNINVSPVGLLNGTLCVGDVVDFTVSISPPPFLGSATTIQWYQDGVHLPAYDNMGTFDTTLTVDVPNICFKAKISHCSKTAEFSSCIIVDPMPMCGKIDKAPDCMTLSPVAPPWPIDKYYSICPGNDAFLHEASPFINCIPQWQYTTDHVTWNDLGFSNPIQNTNELPGDWALLIPLPDVYYRIKCNPKHTPSGCEPCYSNEVRIKFITPPPPDVITGLTRICSSEGGTTLSVAAPNPAFTYTWYWNGLEVQSGPSATYFASKNGCYWVDISNGCQTTQTPWHCLEICELIAAITCPLLPNECASLGSSITLDACVGTTNSCGGSPANFSYTWSWVDNGTPQSTTGCTIAPTPPMGGTRYDVTVTDPATGCIDKASITVKPCHP